MSSEIKIEFQDYLLPHEQIKWTGRPGQGFRLRMMDWFFIPFSALWLGGVLYWEYLALSAGEGLGYVVFGAVFFSIGFVIMVGRFFIDANARKNQTYAVTNRRVIIREKASINSFDLSQLPNLFLNSSGSIDFIFKKLFDISPHNMRDSFGIWAPSLMMNSFEFLDEPQKIYQLILVAIDERQRNPSL
ncbi:MAG: hypothetical protein FD163_1460 [Hyphomonadaceae bacterium]|nr:MAG: hypothetical protein FD128_1204 [Hyphomonadaceae bacterium]KAF0184763.1 MAG: hypothetical protein FD163_1460 [Hyphomonadaceae bacterium]